MTLGLVLSQLWAPPSHEWSGEGTSPSAERRTDDRIDAVQAEREAERRAERALVERIRDGDANAFRVLMETHFTRATRFAYTFVHERDLADDIAQDVFTRIWDVRHNWNPAVSIRAYVLGAIRHRALDVLKHRGVEARYVLLERAHGEADETMLDDGIDRATTLRALARAVAELPERRQAALALRYTLGLTHAEVGDALGVSAKAAKELIVRTLDSLRVTLRAQC